MATNPKELYIPVLHAFENGNTFSGSYGRLRFFLDPKDGQIRVAIWHGEYCMDKSEIEQERLFPLSEEGREQIRAWLESVK